ncbi:MAG TPA: hypothetical protein VNZ57_16220 [Longimicrobiales bacterium]|nr:hypothetical protein [Longimicrobiales bacterium]
MILHCEFEELAAANAGARRLLSGEQGGSGAGVIAPAEAIADVEALLPRLEGDIDIHTLAEQQQILRALGAILEQLREDMDRTILENYVGAEDAVVAYFDYAHVLTLYDRAERIGKEMGAMIELMTGKPPTPETARTVVFE